MSDEGLLAYIVQLEKMYAKADAEIARLREFNDAIIRYAGMREAAQEIDRLKEENARLREALEKIANNADQYSKVWVAETAHAALAEEEKKP